MDGDIRITLRSLLVAFFRDIGYFEELIENMDLFSDLGLDSMNFLSLVVCVEETFGITVPDEKLEYEYFNNVDHICTVIEEVLLNQE